MSQRSPVSDFQCIFTLHVDLEGGEELAKEVACLVSPRLSSTLPSTGLLWSAY